MSALFSPLALRGITFKNRIAVSPMCQYSAKDGFADDWHLVHLGSRAVGGAGLVIVEATAVSPEGRITPGDLGIWKEEHIAPLERITRFIKANSAVPGIQLAHAGRKASHEAPWKGGKALEPGEGDWPTVAPSAEAFKEGEPTPEALTAAGIQKVIDDFAAAAHKALQAGFEVIEIHAAHGYLLHEFYSPLSNHRTDEWGGSFEGRTGLLLTIAKKLRAIVPEHLPLLVRISASDWTEGGWTIEDSIRLAGDLKTAGIDLIDCSSGGNVPKARIPAEPLYQTSFAEQVKKGAGIATGAVGLITTAQEAEDIVKPAVLIWCCWPANCCVTLIFRCMRLKSWALTCPGRFSTKEQNKRLAA